MSKMETVFSEQKLRCSRAKKKAHDKIRLAKCVLTPHKSCRFKPELIQIVTSYPVGGLLKSMSSSHCGETVRLFLSGESCCVCVPSHLVLDCVRSV